MSATKLKPLTFTIGNGISVTIQAEAIAGYASLKSSQLKVLNQIISNESAGFEAEIDADEIIALAGIAEEHSIFCNEIMNALAGVAFAQQEEDKAKKGGAK